MQDLFNVFMRCINKRLICSMVTEKTNEYFKVSYNPDNQTYTRNWFDEEGVCYTNVMFPFRYLQDPTRPLDKLASYIIESYPEHVRHVEVRGQALWIYHI
jgi:hypothetical protein